MVSRIPDIPLEQTLGTTDVPVVIGHYTLSGEPHSLSERVVCVDYNAAKADNPLYARIQEPGPRRAVTGTFVSSPMPPAATLPASAGIQRFPIFLRRGMAKLR